MSVVTPTYNERENIEPLFDGLRAALEGHWDFELIVVDDNSPDGTSETVRRQQERDPRISLIRRPYKQGLGSALVEGFAQATGDCWVMMDADLSHNPSDVPALLTALSDNDIAIGSRHVKGGGIRDWPLRRRVMSQGASTIARLLLRMRYRDLTSGFAAFRKDAIAPLLHTLDPKGFKLLLEILTKADTAAVVEVPIIFSDRHYGRSKFTLKEVVLFLRLCVELRGNQGSGSRE